MLAASLQRDTGLCARNASTARFLSHPSTTAVIVRLQTHSKELAPTIHGHLARASVLTAVATATASHTPMCGIRGQGSRVVLGGLNGALCVIIQTSSNRRGEEFKKPRASLCAAETGQEFSFSRKEMMFMSKSCCSTCEPAAYKRKFRFRVNYSSDQQVSFFSQIETTLLSGQEGRI